MTKDPYARAQVAVLELFGVDSAEDLNPAQKLRFEIATALKTLFDGQQNQLLDGKSIDPLKLLAVVDALTKLTPAPPPEAARQTDIADPHAEYARLVNEALSGMERQEVREVEALREENEALRAERGVAPDAATSPKLLPPPAKALPPPQPLNQPPQAVSGDEAKRRRDAVNSQPLPAWAHGYLKENQPPEPWRNFISPGGEILQSTPRGGKWWGPV